MTFFSIIIASKNSSKTIERTISSIHDQLFEDYEIVYIDGNSNDGTKQIINNNLNKNDQFISEDDTGIYDAFNKGILLAKGKYITFLNSDDYYISENVLSNIYSLFILKQCDLIYGNVQFLNDKNKIIRKYKSRILNINNLSKGFMPAHTATFFKKDLFVKYGLYKTNFIICGDYEFIVRITVQKKDLECYKLDRIIVNMKLGGMSQFGFYNTLKINKEIQKSLNYNGINVSIFTLYMKYFKKFFELRLF